MRIVYRQCISADAQISKPPNISWTCNIRNVNTTGKGKMSNIHLVCRSLRSYTIYKSTRQAYASLKVDLDDKFPKVWRRLPCSKVHIW